MPTCGCHIAYDAIYPDRPDLPMAKSEIQYCPMHEAAEEMLAIVWPIIGAFHASTMSAACFDARLVQRAIAVVQQVDSRQEEP